MSGGNVDDRALLRGAEHSLTILQQVNSYLNVGMDHVIEVMNDFEEYDLMKGM